MRLFLTLCTVACLMVTGVAALAAENDAAGAHAIPFKRAEDSASASSLWRVVLGFGVVVAVGIGAVYVLKRYVPASIGSVAKNGARIDVLEIRRVTTRMTLFLIRVDGETILMAQSGDRVEVVPLKSSRPNSPESLHS
jgi:flagellar biogenesis protein FliO